MDHAHAEPAQQEDEDDYLTMTFEDPTPSTKTETLTQKKKRLAREAEMKGRPKSKAEIAAEEKLKRDEALKKNNVDANSKGFKMMAALGYKPGTALGVARDGAEQDQDDTRLLEPIGLELREGRSGIGADAEKKRKFRQEAAAAEEDLKKRKVDEGDFRERQMKEREEKRKEGQLFGAMKVCDELQEDEDSTSTRAEEMSARKRPLSGVNVLWRGLVKQRLLQERDRRMRYDLHQSLSRRPTYDDPDEDKDDQIALAKKADTEVVGVELDQDDPDLDTFESMSIAERLDKVVSYLRERWHYCFWCKHKYPDNTMDGCPGLTEGDHD
jgi:hypothetical protein